MPRPQSVFVLPSQAAASSSSSSTSTATSTSSAHGPSTRSTCRRSPYTPPPRRSMITADPALGSLGAFYIGWGEQKDPAPLCCPVAKKGIKERYGEAAVGWSTVPAPAPENRQNHQHFPQPAVALSGVPLPPIPSLPATRSRTAAAVSTHQQQQSHPPLPAHAFSSFASSPLAFPSTTSTSTSTPPELSYSSSASASPDSCTTSFSPVFPPSTASFDPTFSLALSSFAFQHQPYPFAPHVLPTPPSALSAAVEQPPLLLPTAVKPSLSEGELDISSGFDSLWSAGEDGGGLLYHGTDVESEASWGAW